MEDAQGQEVQAQSAPETPVAPAEGGGGNPAWGEFLEKVPQMLHPQITPVLEKWDKGVQDRFNSIREEYSGYEPYKQFIDSGISPDNIQYALNIVEGLNQDPRRVYDAIADYYKLDQGQVPQSDDYEGYEGVSDSADPRVNALEQQVNQLTQVIQQQAQASQASQEDAALQSQLDSLKQKHGDYDEQFVLGQMIAGQTGEQAVNNYMAMRESIKQELAQKPTPPQVLGSGGGSPTGQPIDPTKLSGRETKDLIAQMLKASKG